MAAAAPLSPRIGAHRVALRVLPLHEGQPCGDAALCLDLPAALRGPGEAPHHPPHHLLAIVDGLGHGPAAAHAAETALRLLAEHAALALPELMDRLDTALTATRGAAVGLVRIEGFKLLYAGVGNTRALRWRGDHLMRLSSQYGIVGGGLPEPVQVTEIDLLPGDWLLLFTDGLDEMLQLPAHLPEWERDPGLLCEHLLARWRHVRDDAGVLAFLVAAA